jgi:hypothetical protein
MGQSVFALLQRHIVEDKSFAGQSRNANGKSDEFWTSAKWEDLRSFLGCSNVQSTAGSQNSDALATFVDMGDPPACAIPCREQSG